MRGELRVTCVLKIHADEKAGNGMNKLKLSLLQFSVKLVERSIRRTDGKRVMLRVMWVDSRKDQKHGMWKIRRALNLGK